MAAPPERTRRAHNLHQASIFDGLAGQFDEVVPEEVQQRLARIVQASGLKAGEAVLDVGTGTGVLLSFILSRRPLRVTACDLSREMLARARARFKGRVRFVQRDVVDLRGAVSPVDVVFCNACFGNFYDPYQALEAINDLLCDGGRLVISHPMGKGFLRHLKEERPDMVAWELPERGDLEGMLDAKGFGLDLLRDESDLYIAVAKKVSPRELAFAP